MQLKKWQLNKHNYD